MEDGDRDRLVREALQWKAREAKPPPEPPPPPVTLRPVAVGGTAAGILLAVMASLYLLWIFSGTQAGAGAVRHVPLGAPRPVAAALSARVLQHPHVVYVRPSPRPARSPRREAPAEASRGAATYAPPPPGPNAGSVTI